VGKATFQPLKRRRKGVGGGPSQYPNFFPHTRESEERGEAEAQDGTQIIFSLFHGGRRAGVVVGVIGAAQIDNQLFFSVRVRATSGGRWGRGGWWRGRGRGAGPIRYPIQFFPSDGGPMWRTEGFEVAVPFGEGRGGGDSYLSGGSYLSCGGRGLDKGAERLSSTLSGYSSGGSDGLRHFCGGCPSDGEVPLSPYKSHSDSLR
jgi:hypothetical protein